MATNSLVDKLKELGQASDLNSRANLAVEKGLVKTSQEYLSRAAAGTNGDINTQLLGILSAPPVQPGATTQPAGSSTGASSTGTASTSLPNSSTSPIVTNAPITSSQFSQAATMPNPTSFIQSNTGNSLADTISQVAKLNITDSNKQAIDALRATLQANTSTEKIGEQTKVNEIEQGIKRNVGSTASKDALESAYETFKVKENLALYTDIQNKIVEAQKALEMGLIYEGDRPARMQFISGAKSTLQKQGLATIGALQGTAAVIKGNIDLAKSFADATVNAINSDNERSFNALTTLLNLHSGNLIRLTADEKNQINDRISAIEDEAERLQKNKDDVVSYMTSYPDAFLRGGVTLLDNRETALRKMLPYLREDDRAKLEADLELKKSQAAQNYAAANKSTSETGGKKDTPEVKGYKDEIAQLFAQGVPYAKVLAAYGALVPISYINEVYGQKDSMNFDQRVQNQFLSQYYNPDGSLKPGYKFTGKTDTKGNPIVESTSATDGFWSNIGQAFKSLVQ